MRLRVKLPNIVCKPILDLETLTNNKLVLLNYGKDKKSI